MKKSFSKVFLFLLLVVTPLLSQSDCANTPNTGAPLSLALPIAHCQQWNVQLNANFNALNAFAGGVVLLNPAGSQTITQGTGTSVNINSLQVFGVAPNLAFGNVAGTETGYLTEIAPGDYTFDQTTPGDGLGSISLAAVNVNIGYVFNGGTGVTTGQCLVAGSTAQHLFTPQPCVNSSTVFYQTVDANGTGLTQRSALNFDSHFTLADSASPSMTTASLNTTGSEAKVVTASAAGTSGNCVTWDGSAGVGDFGTPCGVAVTQNVVTGSRSFGTTYHNTGVAELLSGYGTITGGSGDSKITCSTGPSTASVVVYANTTSATISGEFVGFNCLVPAGYFYSITVTNLISSSPGQWVESTL